jgi:hypothetical protein
MDKIFENPLVIIIPNLVCVVIVSSIYTELEVKNIV